MSSWQGDKLSGVTFTIRCNNCKYRICCSDLWLKKDSYQPSHGILTVKCAYCGHISCCSGRIAVIESRLKKPKKNK